MNDKLKQHLFILSLHEKWLVCAQGFSPMLQVPLQQTRSIGHICSTRYNCIRERWPLPYTQGSSSPLEVLLLYYLDSILFLQISTPWRQKDPITNQTKTLELTISGWGTTTSQFMSFHAHKRLQLVLLSPFPTTFQGT